MWFNHIYVTTILFLSLYCKSGDSQALAEKECQKIIKNYQASMGNYIVGGKEASLGEFPYQVALALDLKDGPVYHCGGGLVTADCVVTAAHCVDTLDPKMPIIVRHGSIDVSNPKWNPKTDRKVAQRTINPKYNRDLKYHDMAVLRLDSPVKLSANAYPICLETNDADPKGPLTIAGWGKTTNNGTTSNKLRKATLTSVPQNICKTSYDKFKKDIPDGVTPDILCAKDSKSKQDTCQGDSGGPLVVVAKDGKSRLVGITAFGRSCGSKHPNAFMRISRYVKWIEEKCGFTK